MYGSRLINNQGGGSAGDSICLHQIHVFNNVEFNVADRWKAVGDFVQELGGNSARLAELRRELQERHLGWVIVIQM
jgi:hypothetical protein